MSIRDKENEKLNKYEENLKSHIEIEKSNIETILRVSMPHQLSNIKTILWVNLVLLGLSLSIFYKLPFNLGIVFMWISSFVAITLNVIALLGRRYKIYPEIDKMYAYKIYDNQYSRSLMLGEILTTIKSAVNSNRNIMAEIAKFMHSSLYLTLASLFFFFVYLGIATFQLKECHNGSQTTATASKTINSTKTNR